MTEVMMTVANKLFMLSVIMMNAVMMSAIMLNVEALKLRQALIFFISFKSKKITYTSHLPTLSIRNLFTRQSQIWEGEGSYFDLILHLFQFFYKTNQLVHVSL
jgi:hypothetical protein